LFLISYFHLTTFFCRFVINLGQFPVPEIGCGQLQKKCQMVSLSIQITQFHYKFEFLTCFNQHYLEI